MFYKHIIINNENETSLFLFLDTKNEFSETFNIKNAKRKATNIYNEIKKYIKDKKIDFNKGKVFLVVGGVIIATLFISNIEYKENIKDNYQYAEVVDLYNSNLKKESSTTAETNKLKESQSIIKEKQTTKTENYNNTTSGTNTTNNTTSNAKTTNNATSSTNTTNNATSNTNTTTNTTSGATTSSNTTSSTNTSSSSNNTTTQSQTNNVVEEENPAPTQETPQSNETYVTVYRSNGTVEQITLDNYVIGVVAAEMPASFNTEALKAQSVLARTYALKKISANQVLTDTTSTQVYKDQSQLQSLWGASYQTYYNKVKNAVTATSGQYLTYNGNYIGAVYHSTSNGQTEDASVVWGNSYPYLITVDSHWDLQASSYLRETTKDFNVISSILGIPFNESTTIEVLSRTSSNRIDKIKIGDTIYSGVQLRNLLGLRSADFDIIITNGIADFITRGYGHGVGMSQYGANGTGNEGYTYQQILAHYYPGTSLK